MVNVATRSAVWRRPRASREELSFLVDSFHVKRPWKSFREREGGTQEQSRAILVLSGACLRILENPNGDGNYTTPLAVLITATGLQDEKSLVNRRM